MVTVTSGTMIGYKSAIVWLHKWVDSSIGKVAVPFDPELDALLGLFMSGYTRDIAGKRKIGVMKCKEGKDPLSREGYEALAKHMYLLEPDGNTNNWSEIIFVNLYYRLQMNSIGRSDNIEDRFDVKAKI